MALGVNYKHQLMTQPSIHDTMKQELPVIMGMSMDADIIIIGGGLAGLVAATALSKNGKRVLLLEKKTYPYHKVCGEYISNEVLGYMQSLGFDPMTHGASCINKLRVSTPKGKNIYTPLDMGGFGISRYTLDFELYQLAQRCGANVLTGTKVTDVKFNDDYFIVATSAGTTYTAKLVIGSYGKRDTLDKKLDRDFIKQHTRYMGVKYHVKTDYPADEIGLDNFDGGYCGISRVEGDTYNLCYLYKRPEQRNYKTISELQEQVLYKNPVLKRIFTSSDFLFEAPEVINEICFEPKQLIEHHILMCGDTAGLITPLCGNGMSMAITAAKLLSELIIKAGDIKNVESRALLEAAYQKTWSQHFSRRLFWGRTIQRFFGNPQMTGLFIRSVHLLPPLERQLVAATHGKAIM